MRSTKILTLNPIPSGVNQKLVSAKKYNELWDDVERVERRTYIPTIIGDKGLGDSIIILTGTPIYVSFAGTNNPTGYTAVAVKDFLTSIHYTGSGVLQYSIRKNGEPAWITSPDPSLAKVSLTCNDIGGQVFEIKVGDGSIESTVLSLTGTIQDDGICGVF